MNPSAKPPVCAICRKRPIEAEYKPFCSRRCADLDLQKWFTGRYSTPAVTPPGAEGDDED
jgi:endogenous inhibitor of DNA gyrase (YacG/DUF329 family)